jgi:hypothetical protein
MLARNVEQRRQYADKSCQFIDFPIQRIVRDPITCAQEIYKHFDIELSDQTHQKMSRFMEERGMDKRKPHIYHAEDYGLDIDELWHELQYYRDFYRIADKRDRSIQ